MGGDLCELQQDDYSYKAVKTAVAGEQRRMQEAQYRLTIPVQYGAQADLGRYSAPDGPVPNWSQLMPQGRIAEARAAQEEAARRSRAGHVQGRVGAVGGRRRRRRLRHQRRRRRRRSARRAQHGATPACRLPRPGHRGRHGVGVRARHARRARVRRREAGRRLWPAGPAAPAAGLPAPPSSGRRSTSTRRQTWPGTWRGRSTIIKPCMEVAEIPVHLNVGMGVGGVPMHPFPRSTPSRAPRAPSSRSCASTACRWAQAMPWACTWHTCWPRG